MKINLFWFRRDLRLADNTGLYKALEGGLPVLPVFIFDDNILDELPRNDARVNFIHNQVTILNDQLGKYQSGLLIIHNNCENAFLEILKDYQIQGVFANKDYEPKAIARDSSIRELLESREISLNLFKDQVIYEESEVVKPDGKPYSVYTPYMKKWQAKLASDNWQFNELDLMGEFYKHSPNIPSLSDLGFEESSIKVKPINLTGLADYEQSRNIPSQASTSNLSPHLRFGTVSIRQIVSEALSKSETFVNELIWREFFMQILFHFPHVVDRSFKSKYDKIVWRNNEDEFQLWCDGKTGYPIVDAGMRELNETGYMHNRVRMITASFLVKHLLIDWRWGEAYFAEKLIDFELASNNGNWQWVAGTGCDAAPYFRVFNPSEQQKKFDPDYLYISKWVPEINEPEYPEPMVDHRFARQRALDRYASGID